MFMRQGQGGNRNEMTNLWGEWEEGQVFRGNKSLFLFLSFSVICDLGYHLCKVMHSSLCSCHILVVSTPWSPPPSPEVVGGTGARRRPGYGGQTVAPSCGGRFNRGGTSVKSISETWGTNESNLGKKWCREYWPGMTSYFGNKRANSPRWQSCKKDECVTQLQQFRILLNQICRSGLVIF